MSYIRRSITDPNLPNIDHAFNSKLSRILEKLDLRDDIYGEVTLAGTCHLNGTIVSVPCAGAVMGAPYFFNTGALSSNLAGGTGNVTCTMNLPNAVRVASTGNLELTWNAAMNTAGDVVGGAGAMLFVEGRRIRRK
jgi:hypothetical protein